MRAMRAVLLGCGAGLLLAGCATLESGGLGRGRSGAPLTPAQREMADRIALEPPGNHYIARRYFKNDYKFWGFVRRPGQQWRAAKLVMLNEQRRLAPDREAGTLGVDNNVEYRLQGRFTGEQVYEPASNGFYPEFLLEGYEVLEREPPSIFPRGAPNLPASRVLQNPA